jgi:SRSO17 transposase
VTVNCHYAEQTIAWPVAMRLYLPEFWSSDTLRRQKAHIPADVQFQTKPEIALALLDQAKEWHILHTCIIADADYGDNPNFLDGLEQRDEWYVVAIRADFRVAVAGTGNPGPSERTRSWRRARSGVGETSAGGKGAGDGW